MCVYVYFCVRTHTYVVRYIHSDTHTQGGKSTYGNIPEHAAIPPARNVQQIEGSHDGPGEVLRAGAG